jgi:thymidylate kinase
LKDLVKQLIPKTARLIVLEGIAGSGKTTLKRHLKQAMWDQVVYDYTEEELFLGWKHVHLPRLSSLRLIYYQILLDDLERKMATEPEALFILERFHLSVKVLEWEFEMGFERQYERLLERLRRLPVFVLIARLEPEKIKERMLHRERCRQWDNFIQEKLTLRGYTNLERLSIEQQEAFFQAAKDQGIPFASIEVALDHL